MTHSKEERTPLVPVCTRRTRTDVFASDHQTAAGLFFVEVYDEPVIRIPKHRAPTHPGQMLLEEFLKPMELTQRQVAEAIHVPYQRVNEIINGRRGMTSSTALRLERFLGMSADFWMDLQMRWDLYHAQEDEASELKAIKRYPAANHARSA